MKEAIWGYLAKSIGKTKNLLSCRSTEQTTGRILPASASGNSFHTWLQKVSQHTGPAAHKRNTRRCALISLRLLLVFMSVCISFLLTLAVQGMTNSPALAVASVAPTPNPNGFNLYVGFCQSFTHEQVPAQWTDPAFGDVCDAGSPAGFIQPSGGRACPQNFIKTMNQTGQEECALAIPSLRSECPLGFSLDGGLCEYEPQDGADWQVGYCRSFKSYEIPKEWVAAGVCNVNPVPSGFAQPSGGGSCPQNTTATTIQTGQVDCVLTIPSLRNLCPVAFALDGGLCEYQPQQNTGTWQVGFCRSFKSYEVPTEWISSHVCDTPPPTPNSMFVQPAQNGACQQDWIKTMTQTGQVDCVLTVPAFNNSCPVGFALKDGWCEYRPQHSGSWEVGFCKSFDSDEVPPEWVSNGVCNIDPIPNPEQVFVQPASTQPCQQSWVKTMTQTGQQECVLTIPTLRNLCPIGFAEDRGLCEYQPQNRGNWQVGFCKSFTNDEIPPEWIAGHVCDTGPIPNPEQTFITPEPCLQFSIDRTQCLRLGPCPQYWIATTAQSPQVQCLLTIPQVRGLCPVGFELDSGRCDYVPQGQTSWQAGFCRSFSSDEIPPVWRINHICDIPSPDPEQVFIKGVPCLPSWIETTNAKGDVECILTVPSVRGLCPVGFALDGNKCDYVPQDKVTWVVGFCKSFDSDEVPVEWMVMHVCDTNPVPDPEQTFIKDGPCVNGWIRTVAEGGNAPKCALTVPAIKELCPIGFALDGANCNYVPRNPMGWQFPCSDRTDGTPNEQAIARDWLSGESPQTQNITSDATVTDGTTGGRFVHTFAVDTYGLQSVQEVFGYMLGLAFLLVTPMIILIGYHMMLAASSFRHAGVMEGLSRVLLGGLAVGVSFQLVTMLISAANVISSAIVDLHGMLGYAATQIYGVRAAYTLAGVPEPLTSYRGLVMPMSRWGCAVNDFIGILGNQFFKDQMARWLPVIGNLAPLATQVTNGAQLVSRLTEFAKLELSVVLWLQVVVRIGILNCYILTCPLAFAGWSLPGGLGRQVLHQWMRGFLSVLFIQVGQLFFITTLPLILPSFPTLAGDQQGIMYVLLTQLPPLLVLWLTVRVPKFVGISTTRAIGMTGAMASGIVGVIGVAASQLG